MLRDKSDKYRLSFAASDILRRLDTYKSLKEDWDNNRASPPSKEVINEAISFLVKTEEASLPIFFAAPGPEGEILLEYKRDDLSAEIYFEPKGFSEMILYSLKEQVYDGEIDFETLVNFFY